MSSCTQFLNSTSTTILEPPTHAINITNCAINVYGNSTDVLKKCSNSPTISTYENGCFAYVNLSTSPFNLLIVDGVLMGDVGSTSEDAKDAFGACLRANGVSSYVCSTNLGPVEGTKTSATGAGSTTVQTGSASASVSVKPNDSGVVGISKSVVALSLIMGFGILFGVGL